ncbi:hypothetical protein B0H17DRAFT_1148084 [Mycena rosella]|uniref:Uncharacterized protein n=1 Tax=Mycena rosella TaxID=1033263 RepID=A0AAD7CGY5_MYCRO|nr:hypothetical protein B0H17DRAFT_1148084 [Mycena rosella]
MCLVQEKQGTLTFDPKIPGTAHATRAVRTDPGKEIRTRSVRIVREGGSGAARSRGKRPCAGARHLRRTARCTPSEAPAHGRLRALRGPIASTPQRQLHPKTKKGNFTRNEAGRDRTHRLGGAVLSASMRAGSGFGRTRSRRPALHAARRHGWKGREARTRYAIWYRGALRVGLGRAQAEEGGNGNVGPVTVIRDA